MTKNYDIVIIGAGIVGLASAYQIQNNFKNKRILIDDFVIEIIGRILSVINEPSPAATSSFSIGIDIMKKIKYLI